MMDLICSTVKLTCHFGRNAREVVRSYQIHSKAYVVKNTCRERPQTEERETHVKKIERERREQERERETSNR